MVPKPEHLKSLTSLRFVAALMVFFSHVRHQMFDGASTLQLGGPAVSFFFVLSGFILTHVYNGQLRTVGLRRFYATRLARIWPVHVVCLGLVLITLNSVQVENAAAADSWLSLTCQALLLHAWVPLDGWMLGFNSVSWSISTEAFFYLTFPVFLLLPMRRLLLAFVVVVMGAVALLTWGQHQQNMLTEGSIWDWTSLGLCHPLVRLPEFVLGIVTYRVAGTVRPSVLKARLLATNGSGGGQAAAASRKPTSERAGRFLRDTFWELAAIGAIVGAWIAFTRANLVVTLPHMVGVVYAAWIRVAGGCLLFAITIAVFARSRGLLAVPMHTKLAVWLGEISYAFYLVHQIVVRLLNETLLTGGAFIAVSLVLSISLAALLYRFVEMPAKNAARAWMSGKRIGAAEGRYRRFVKHMSAWPTWLPLGAAIVMAGLVQSDVLLKSTSELAAEVIEATPAGMRDVRFEGEAILKGFRTERVDGGRRVWLVWQPIPGGIRQRFVHITDLNGDILAQMPLKTVSTIGDDEYVVDEFRIPNSKIYRGAWIGTGFWSEAAGSTGVVAPEDHRVAENGQGAVTHNFRFEFDTIKQRNWR